MSINSRHDSSSEAIQSIDDSISSIETPLTSSSINGNVDEMFDGIFDSSSEDGEYTVLLLILLILLYDC